jgi:hypothetical protein
MSDGEGSKHAMCLRPSGDMSRRCHRQRAPILGVHPGRKQPCAWPTALTTAMYFEAPRGTVGMPVGLPAAIGSGTSAARRLWIREEARAAADRLLASPCHEHHAERDRLIGEGELAELRARRLGRISLKRSARKRGRSLIS